MHPVDGNELFGERERCGVVIGGRTDDAGEHLAVADAADALLELLAERAVPVGVHADLQRRVAQHAGGPLHGVDLGDQSRYDQNTDLEETLIVEARVRLLHRLDDGVVLAREQRVQQADTDPPVLAHTSQVDTGDVALRKATAVVDLDLAVDIGANLALAVPATAVDLRSVPPMGLGLAKTGAGQPSLISPFSGTVHRIFIGFSGKVSPSRSLMSMVFPDCRRRGRTSCGSRTAARPRPAS